MTQLINSVNSRSTTIFAPKPIVNDGVRTSVMINKELKQDVTNILKDRYNDNMSFSALVNTLLSEWYARASK